MIGGENNNKKYPFLNHFRESIEYGIFLPNSKVLQPNGSLLYENSTNFSVNFHFIVNPKDSTRFFLIAGISRLCTSYDYGSNAGVTVSFSSFGYNLGLGLETPISKSSSLLFEVKYSKFDAYNQYNTITNVIPNSVPADYNITIGISHITNLNRRMK
jgi:opacity protein-like surface antigen